MRRAVPLLLALTFVACSDEPTFVAFEVDAVFEPASLDFGEVAVGARERRTVAFRNTGQSNLTIEDAFVPQSFALPEAKGTLIGQTIAPSAAFSFDVEFAPSSAGQTTETLTLTVGNGVFELPLRGFAGLFPSISVDPGAIDFGTIAVGDTGRWQVVLTNTGGVEVEIDQVQIEDPGTFRISAADSFNIPVGQARAVDILFEPQREASFEDVVRFEYGTRVAAVSVRGASLSPAGDVLCSPTAVDFGPVERGREVQAAVTCTALGGPARIVRALVEPSPDGFRLVSPVSTVDLAEGQSTSFFVALQADGLAGQRAGRLRIDYNGARGAGTQVLNLLAQVIAPPPTENDMTLILRWDTPGDVDLHFVRPGGVLFSITGGDCHYAVRSPDWGVPGDPTDNPFLDVDNRLGFGPETINLSRAQPGRYQVWVHYFRAPFGRVTNAAVDVFVGGANVGTFTLPLTCKRAWLVGIIEWFGDSGIFTPDVRTISTPEGRCD